jgi:hypothetical protein
LLPVAGVAAARRAYRAHRCLDRSALYGVLAEIEALGLDLLDLLELRRRLEPPGKSPGSGDRRSP